MIKPLLWRLLNMTQVAFFFFWSFYWQSTSVLLRLLGLISEEKALRFATKYWAPALIRITGSKLDEVRGLEKVDFSKPHIFVCNHQSTLDIAVAFSAIPVPLRFVAKKELQYVPFLGWYMLATGMIFVDRKKRHKAVASLKRAGDLIRNGANVVAFPEGTRSDDGAIHPFKKGIFVVAIESGVPVVPVAIEGTRFIMPKNTFRLRPHTLRVSIGDPIPTEHLTYEDRETLRLQAQDAMIELNKAIGGLGATPSLAEANAQRVEESDAQERPKRPKAPSPSYAPTAGDSERITPSSA